MATCFWVGGTASWDNTNTGGGGAGGIKWASTSGGSTAAGGAGPGGSPAAADNATFDASSGGGVVTVNATIAVTDFNMSAYTGQIDFSVNNNNITLSGGSGAFTRTGSATNRLDMGNGTWTLSGASGSWNAAGSTNFTLNRNSSTIAFTTTSAGARTFNGGTSQTYNIITVAGNSNNNALQIAFATALTITTLTVTAPNRIVFPNSQTTTISTISNISGSSSQQVFLSSNSVSGGSVATISLANNFAGDWCGFSNLTFTGAGVASATNSFNLIGNTGVAITPPSVGGGGGGQRVISG